MKTKKSLMTRAAALLMVLVLPFNMIGIAEALLSYRSAVESAETAVSHSIELYASLLDRRISNMDTFLYDMVFTEPAYRQFLGGKQHTRTQLQQVPTVQYAQNAHDDRRYHGRSFPLRCEPR